MPDRAKLSDVPKPALYLGFAGLIPFLAGTLGVWVAPAELVREAVYFQLAYGAVILSFMGAVHWGLAMAGGEAAMSYRRLGWSVVPALLAWVALLLHPIAGLLLMATGFAGVFFGDLRSIAAGNAPPWYRALRKPLTLIVILSLASTLGGVVAVIG